MTTNNLSSLSLLENKIDQLWHLAQMTEPIAAAHLKMDIGVILGKLKGTTNTQQQTNQRKEEVTHGNVREV